MKPNKDLDKAINNIKAFLDQQWIVMNQPEKPRDYSEPEPDTFEMKIHPFISIYKKIDDRWGMRINFSQEAFLLDYEKQQEKFYLPKAPLNYGFQTKIESINKNDSGDLILKLNITNLLESQTFEHSLIKTSQKNRSYNAYEMDKMYKQKTILKN